MGLTHGGISVTRLISSFGSDPSSVPQCTQPQCPLRRIQFNRTRLAELLVRSVTRESEALPSLDGREIVPEEQCVACALRVVRGQRPFPTREDKNRIANEHEGHECSDHGVTNFSTVDVIQE